MVEQKPSGMWVIDTSVHFRDKRTGDYDVEILLDPEIGFVIVDMGDTKVGVDHDNCLSPGDPEHYAQMQDTDIEEEKSSNESATSDDCVPVA